MTTALQTTCSGTTVGNLLANATVTVRFPIAGGGTADVTGTVVSAGASSPTVAQAVGLVPTSGQAGVACASVVGQTCQVAGVATGTGTVTGSMTWNLTATAPVGVAAGVVPVAVLATTQGLQGFPCAPVTAAGASVTCVGATAGNALQGSTATVVFAAGVVVTGVVTGPGGAALILPLAPLPLLPPPLLAPPLPPPPRAPTSLAPTRPMAEVPVIPEADSLALLLGGLLGLGLLAGRRAARRSGH